jgi:hypothetical protein
MQRALIRPSVRSASAVLLVIDVDRRCVTVPLIWDFIGKAHHARVPPGGVERRLSSAFGEPTEGPPAGDRIKDPPQQMKSHKVSVPTRQAYRVPFSAPAGTTRIDVHIFRQRRSVQK